MKNLFYIFFIVNFLLESCVINASDKDINQRVFDSVLHKTLVIKREQLQSSQLNYAKKLYLNEFAELYWTQEKNSFGIDKRQESISLCDIADENGNGFLDQFGISIIQRRCINDSECDNEKYLSFLKLHGIESFYDDSLHRFTIVASFPETKKFKTGEFKRACVLESIKSMMLKNPDGVFGDSLDKSFKIIIHKYHRYVKDAIAEILEKKDQVQGLEKRGIKRSRE